MALFCPGVVLGFGILRRPTSCIPAVVAFLKGPLRFTGPALRIYKHINSAFRKARALPEQKISHFVLRYISMNSQSFILSI